ncbi:hypothetical protein C8Q77DRAFT_677829 [Trametes polyzona]|nr:hypothetical protein C8Q77DRAFT_677829 [Trametes polyzona]
MPSTERATRDMLVDLALYARAVEKQDVAKPTQTVQQAALAGVTPTVPSTKTGKSSSRQRRRRYATLRKMVSPSRWVENQSTRLVGPSGHTTGSAPTPRSSECSWDSTGRPLCHVQGQEVQLR